MGVAYGEREAGRCSILFGLDDGRQLASSSEVVSIRIILTRCYQNHWRMLLRRLS